MFKLYQKFLVLKIEDIAKFLNAYEVSILVDLTRRVWQGRVNVGKSPSHEYIVVSDDEPYYSEVLEMVRKHEENLSNNTGLHRP